MSRGRDLARGHEMGWRDVLLKGLVALSVLLVGLFFLLLLADVLRHGLPRLSFSFLTAAPLNSGRSGGIGPILVSTSYLLLVCLGVALPFGLGTAIWLAELSSPQSLLCGFVRGSLDVLSGVPSIVFGLFGNAFFCVLLGFGFSILSGGLTLACMCLPLLIRSAEQGFRAVPDSYRLAAAALGMTRLRAIRRILLPAAMPGLIVGLVLSVGRSLAETAALIFTSGYVDRMPASLHDSGRALSIHIYDLALNVAGGEPAAYATATVLLLSLLLVNSAASWLADRFLRRGWEQPR